MCQSRWHSSRPHSAKPSCGNCGHSGIKYTTYKIQFILWSKGGHGWNLTQIQESWASRQPGKTTRTSPSSETTQQPCQQDQHVGQSSRPDQTSCIRGESSMQWDHEACPWGEGQQQGEGTENTEHPPRRPAKLKAAETQSVCVWLIVSFIATSVSLVPKSGDGDLWRMFWKTKRLCYLCTSE